MNGFQLSFVAPGEFGGVRSFSADDGGSRLMWTIHFLGGRINGFLKDTQEDKAIYQYLESVPTGTPARAFGQIEVSSADELRLVAESFSLQGTDGFEPILDDEILNGCSFAGMLRCWRKEVFKNGALDLRFSAMGSNYHIRGVEETLFEKVEVGKIYKVSGLLDTTINFVGVKRVPKVGVELNLKSVKEIKLKTDNK